MSDGRLPPRRRWVGWVIGIVLLALALSIGWVVIRGFGAASELQNVQKSVTQLQSSIEDRDFRRAAQIVPRVEQHAARAHDLTSDPVWRAFEFVPWLGRDFMAFREIAEITQDAVDGSLHPVIAIADQADLATLGLGGSHVDLAPLAALQAPLGESAAVLAEADSQAQRVAVDTLLPPIGDVVSRTRDFIHDASAIVGGMHGASVLLPNMLGGNGPRTYVIAVQNNAALRSHGGAVQALVLMRADTGELSIIRTASASEFPVLDAPLPLDEATVALFGEDPGRILSDATSIPALPNASEMIAARVQQQFVGAVDGVITLDIVALQRLAAATGQISFGDFTGDAKNLAEVLGVDIPATDVDPATYDALVTEAATALTSALLTSNDPAAVLSALSDAAADGHIHLWSAHPEEQTVLAASALGGGLPDDTDDVVHIGVLFNGRADGMTDYDASATITHAIGECHGEPTTRIAVTWTNSAGALISIVGPEGATPLESGDASARLGDRPIVQYDLEAPRGESVTITATFAGSGDAHQLVHATHTSMIDDVDVARAALDCG